MENNNGRGIFYGVIGVATLVVAIIGATFAYFSAAASSNNDAVAASSSSLSLTFSDVSTGIKTNLIPIDLMAGDGTTDKSTGAYKDLFASKDIPEVSADSCKDANGNNICSVYEFTVTNPATVNQQIYVTLTTVSNSFTNLKYAIFRGTAAEVNATTNGFKVNNSTPEEPTTACKGTIPADYGCVTTGSIVQTATAVPANGVSASLPTLTQVLAGTVTAGSDHAEWQSATYTIVMWIEETGTDQTESDANKSFAGRIDITTNGSGSGVTGVLAS